MTEPEPPKTNVKLYARIVWTIFCGILFVYTLALAVRMGF
jgi:hypothetical protein